MNGYSSAVLRILALVLLSGGLMCAAQTQSDAAQERCLYATGNQLHNDAGGLGHGLAAAPRNAIRPRNLKWELPIGVATGLMIAKLDNRVATHNESLDRQSSASTWSNVGLGMELGAAGLMWAEGCVRNHETLRENGFVALEAAGAAAGINEVFKIAANRQYPYAARSTGEFWEAGKSFPSGHSAASWAFASALAHRYPHKRWVKWSAYAFATAVSLSRIPAKKHYPSDILVGSTIGYVTGAYLAGR
ncbi:MAG TPA: phosphatase PAP2 family protein [Terriglobales bacterium]